MSGAFAFGIGLGTAAKSGELLEVWYPLVLHQLPDKLSEVLRAVLAGDGAPEGRLGDAALARLEQILAAIDSPELAALIAHMALVRGTESGQQLIGCLLDKDAPPSGAAEAYLKLHLLSLRHVRPNEINLDGIFGELPNVAWTSDGPIKPSEVAERQLQARLGGRQITVHGVDKFPRMTDYVIPSGVRIADSSRVRLGAYIGEGTTVMHEGLVNFNAGTLGTAMVEGRISQGVTVGDQSDLGGSASTMGTLSGGGSEKVSIGERCLIGANAGTGIPLGDDCVIEAGLYVTAGTKVTLMTDGGEVDKIVKARELAGASNLLFIRNSETGGVECRPRRGQVALNESLHAND